MRFAIWTAVSTASQADEDKDSLPEQERKCRAVALARGWVEVSGPYVVPGESRSGYVNLRDAEDNIPALRSMLDDAKHGRFEILIMWDYNRLRSLLEPVAKTLANYGVQLYSVNQPTEPLAPEEFNPYASDSGSMMRGMASIISDWQIADLRRKYRFGVRARVEAGLPSLKIPYGYIRPPGREWDRKAIPIPHPVHSKVVIDLKEKFLSGMSLRKLLVYMSERYLSPSGLSAWHRKTVNDILQSPFYAGKVFFGRRITIHDSRINKVRRVKNNDYMMRDGAHEPLWSWADHLAIMAEYDYWRTAPNATRYPWSGLLFCHACGRRLRRKTDRYKCLSCGMNVWDNTLVDVVPTAIQDVLTAMDLSDLSAPAGGSVSILPALADLEKQKTRIQAGYESEIYTLVQAEDKIKAIDAKIKALRDGELEGAQRVAERESFLRTLNGAQDLIPRISEWITSDESDVVNALLRRLFSGIYITKDGQAFPKTR